MRRFLNCSAGALLPQIAFYLLNLLLQIFDAFQQSTFSCAADSSLNLY